MCRCEEITLKEIKDAIENPLGVKTIVGIKYRTRAMMGRCQGGWCFTKIVSLLENKYNFDPQEIKYLNQDSYLFTGKVK